MAAPESPEHLAKAWLDHCRASGLVAMTLKGYRYTINGVFLPFCEREGIEDISEMTQARFDQLNRELLAREYRGRPISRRAVDHYLRCIRTFCTWVRDEEGFAIGRPRGIRVGKPKPKDVLSRSEIQVLEDVCRYERDKLIIRLMGDTGMRVGELVKLAPGDLLERNRMHFLYVRGKGDNDRWVPIPRLARRLQRYIDRGRGEPCADRIFVSSRLIHGQYKPLTTSGVWQVLAAAAEDARMEKKVHPHLLRHSFITHLRRKGHNDAQISKVVGNFTVLDNYTHLEAGDAYGLVVGLDD